MPYIGKTPTVGNFQVCDAISVVNGQAAYTLQVGGVNVAPESANHMLVSLNGILQKPGSSFTISGSTMTFASNLATGDVIDFVQILGNVLDLGQPSDNTVTAAKLATTSITGQTAETSVADGDTILIHDASASALRKMTKANFTAGVGETNVPAFEASLSAQQNISDATYTKVQCDTELFDTNSAYDNSSNYRFTPQVAGKYFIYGRCGFDDGGNSAIVYTNVAIYKNGSLVHRNYQDRKTGFPSEDGSGAVCGAVSLNGSSDYVELYAYLDYPAGYGVSQAKIEYVSGMTNFGGYLITTS